MAKIDLSTIDTWFEKTGACSSAVDWVHKKKDHLQKIKDDVEKVGKYNMEGSVYVIEQFLLEGHIKWGVWYVIRILETDECEQLTDYILSHLPKMYDEENKELDDFIKETEKAVETKDTNSLTNLIANSTNARLINDPTVSMDDIYKSILEEGLKILKKRKEKNND